MTTYRYVIDSDGRKLVFGEDGRIACYACGHTETVQKEDGRDLVEATKEAAQWHTTECGR